MHFIHDNKQTHTSILTHTRETWWLAVLVLPTLTLPLTYKYVRRMGKTVPPRWMESMAIYVTLNPKDIHTHSRIWEHAHTKYSSLLKGNPWKFPVSSSSFASRLCWVLLSCLLVWEIWIAVACGNRKYLASDVDGLRSHSTMVALATKTTVPTPASSRKDQSNINVTSLSSETGLLGRDIGELEWGTELTKSKCALVLRIVTDRTEVRK